MKTINTILDLDQLSLSNEHRRENFKQALTLRNQILPMHPCTLVVRDPEDPEPTLYLDLEEEIQINQNWKGEFGIFSWKRHKYIDNYTREEIRTTTDQPRNFKVPSKKKIEDWVNTVRLMNKRAEEISAERVQKVESFLRSVADIAARDGYEHRKMQGGQDGGWIEKGPFLFTYEISNEGYISTNLELQRLKLHEDKLTTFIELTSQIQ